MAVSIKFTKMQGLGNDFILVDYEEIRKYNLDYNDLAAKICHRNFGIGADGLIIVNPPDYQTDADTSWRIFNSDGSEPQMCGNGIRCFARYVYEKGIVKKKKFSVQTQAGIIIPEIQDNGEIMVDMGEPIFEAEKISANYLLKIKDKKFNINAVSMGNPHCVIFSDDDTAQLAREYGPFIELHELFPEKTNVEFVKILARDNVKIDVWERGCGITLACGTGACASVAAGIINNFLDDNVTANLPGGSLKIQWKKRGDSGKIYMTGRSEFVFFGDYLLIK